MVITRNIPSFLTIKGIKLNISYQGQMKTCARCDSTTHEARNCSVTNLNYSAAVKNKNNVGIANNHAESLAKAITDLEELVIEAEDIENKKRRNSRESQTGKNNWVQVTKRGRKGSKGIEIENENDKESEMETNSEVEEDEDFVDIIPSKEVQKSKTKKNKKIKKVKISKELKDSKRQNPTSLRGESQDNSTSHENEQNPHQSLYFKTKAILRNRKKFKPVLIQRKSRYTNNGTSGFPWPDQFTQTKGNEENNSAKEDNPTQNINTTSNPDSTHQTNFYDDILTPILT